MTGGLVLCTEKGKPPSMDLGSLNEIQQRAKGRAVRKSEDEELIPKAKRQDAVLGSDQGHFSVFRTDAIVESPSGPQNKPL